MAHCEDLELGGATDWRLPSLSEIEELARGDLPVQYCGEWNCPFYPHFELTGPWVWTSDRASPTEARNFSLDAERGPGRLAMEYLGGALCVREGG